MTKLRCAFCEIPAIKERKIAENKLALAFLTNIPITPGHSLIVPIRCVEKFEDMTKDEVQAIFDLREKLLPALRSLFEAEGFHFAWNEGKVAGQSVPHFHLHIVPRKKGDDGITEYEPRKFLYRPGSREDSPESELKAVSNLIREELMK